MKNNEMIERYVYAVTKQLPQQSREDIEKELMTIIDDMLEELGQTPTQEEINEVLVKLGDPDAIAQKYRGHQNYLIGPKLYHHYLLVLKIVAISLTISLVVGMALEHIIQGDVSITTIITSLISGSISGVFQAFGIVTLIFFLIERNGNNQGDSEKKDWSPKNLKPVPVVPLKINKSSAIAGIIFNLIAGICLTFIPQHIGVFLKSGDLNTTIPLFNLDVLNQTIGLVYIGITLSIVKNIIHLLHDKLTIKVAWVTISLNVIALIPGLLFFLNPNLYNAEFIPTLTTLGFFEKYPPQLFNYEQVLMIFAVIIGLSVVLESGTLLYKAFKYNQN